MDKVFTVALPIFALVGSGWVALRLRLLAEPSVAGLSAFVYYFALPALFFVKLAQTPILALFDWRLLAAYHPAGLVVFALAVLAGRAGFGQRLAVLGLQGAAASYPNVGYMGLALAMAAFGEEATFPALLIATTDTMLTLSLAVALVEAGAGRGHGARDVALAVGGGLVGNPLVVAMAAGTLLGLSGWRLPATLRAFGDLLGAAALPCALFALGASLVGRAKAARTGDVALLVGLKLVVHPLVAWGLATRILALPPLLAGLVTLEAALPTAASVYVLAQRHETYVERTSAVVLLSTLVSVLTVSAVLVLASPP